MTRVGEIHRLMRRQHGCITRRQARDLGLTRHQIDGRLTRGEWRRAERAVSQHCAYPVTWHSRLFAVCRALGVVASHRPAAALWELDGCRRGRVEVTVPATRSSARTGVVVHRSSQWDRIEPTTIDSIPVTGLARTVFDLAGVSSPSALREAANSARRRRQLDWQDLAETLVAGGRRGRDGTAGLRRLLEYYAGEQTLSRSEWSEVVADLLAQHDLPRPQLEYRVDDAQGRFVACTHDTERFVVDVVRSARRLLLERSA